jgi:hypothetical protein
MRVFIVVWIKRSGSTNPIWNTDTCFHGEGGRWRKFTSGTLGFGIPHVMEVGLDFFEDPLRCSLVLLKDLIPFLSDLVPGTFVVQEAFHLENEIVSSLDLGRPPPLG